MHAFIHRGDLYQEAHQLGFRSLVIRAVCAASYRFSSASDPEHPSGGAAAHQWGEDLLLELVRQRNEFTDEILAATIIMASHENTCGRFASGWLLGATAMRIALSMGLHRNRGGQHTRAMESRRRFMWAIFALDAFYCGGIPEFTLCQNSDVAVPLPTSDHAFTTDSPANAPTLQDLHADPMLEIAPEADGLAARFVRLMVIRKDILA